MIKIYGSLAVISFVLSLFVGVAVPVRAERTQETVVLPLFYKLFSVEVQANQLLVITEPSWCSWCKLLHPHLEELKKDGYKIRTYTRYEWNKATRKPTNLPKLFRRTIQGTDSYSIPVVLYVHANKTEYKVVRSHYGGKDKDANYIKKYLTK